MIEDSFVVIMPKVEELYQKITDLFQEEKPCPITIEQFEEANLLLEELTSGYDSSHDVDHHHKVLLNAFEIFSQSWFRKCIGGKILDRVVIWITLSSLLHDTVDYKYPENLEDKKIKLSEYLDQYPDDKDIILHIINNISFSKEIKGELVPFKCAICAEEVRKIISDADKIEAIGIKGIERCRQYAIAKNPNDSSDMINQKIVKHCYEKLLLLYPQYIKTKPGKILAAKGHEEIVAFVKEHDSKNL